MSANDVMATERPDHSPEACPDMLEIDGNQYSLSYRFAVGEADDGVTLTVPRAELGALNSARLEWLIPGWLPDKIVALIRALPKSLRRRLVPAPDVARRCLASLPSSECSLTGALAAVLQREAGVPVPADSWRDADLPEHLSFNIRVVDEEDRILGEGRDLAALRRRFQASGPLPKAAADAAPHYRTWSFGRLAPTLTLREGGRQRRVFVGLHDAGDGVTVGHFASESEAAGEHQRGTLRLLRLACAGEERYLRKELEKRPSLRVAVGAGGDLVADLVTRAARDVLVPEGAPPVRDEQAFEQRLQAGRPALVARGSELAELVAGILESCRTARVRLETELRGPGAQAVAEDIGAQLNGLVYPGFLLRTPARWLGELPRYLHAVHVRLDRLAAGDARDPVLAAEIGRFQRRYDEARPQAADICPALETFRWMLEEYRVSLFAQTLKTAIKVSPQRLERQWDQVGTARVRP
jgi:ATP-dependent helicase HrpA